MTGNIERQKGQHLLTERIVLELLKNNKEEILLSIIKDNCKEFTKYSNT